MTVSIAKDAISERIEPRRREGQSMNGEQPLTNPPRVPTGPVIPLPIGLYESNGLIFELYRGGQPYSPVMIRWERLKTVTVTREDDCASEVHINQGRRELVLDRPK